MGRDDSVLRLVDVVADMTLLCRLYGHQWRHPGVYEVVVRADATAVYPFECSICGSRQVSDLVPPAGTRELLESDPGGLEEDRTKTEPELDTTVGEVAREDVTVPREESTDGLDDEAGPLEDGTGSLDDEAGTTEDETGTTEDETGTTEDETGTTEDET